MDFLAVIKLVLEKLALDLFEDLSVMFNPFARSESLAPG
jgi:hypothetical protein